MPASRTSPRSPSERTRRNGQAGPARRVPALLRCSPGNGLPPAPLRLDEKDSCSFIESGHWLDCARQPASGQPALRSPPASLAPASPDPHDASLPGGVRVLGTLGGSRGTACRRVVPAEDGLAGHARPWIAQAGSPGSGAEDPMACGAATGKRHAGWASVLSRTPGARGDSSPSPRTTTCDPAAEPPAYAPFRRPDAAASMSGRPGRRIPAGRVHAVAAIHVRAATRGAMPQGNSSRVGHRDRESREWPRHRVRWHGAAPPRPARKPPAAGGQRIVPAGARATSSFRARARARENAGHGPHGHGSSGAAAAPATKDGRQAALAWRCASTSSTSATDSSRACISTVRW